MTSTEPGGWESWEWDETLFAGAARYYAQGRVPYAPGLADKMTEKLGLDGYGRLLDVGCGPGTVVLRIAQLFEHAIGLDPDAGMLAEGERVAGEQGITNVSWVQHRAEDLPAGLGQFRVVTLAASFHWMDRPRVAGALRGMLDPGGAAVQIHAPPAEAVPGHPRPPEDEIAALRREYLGADRRAGQGIRNTSPGGEDAVFRAAGFAPAVQVVVPDGRTLTRSADDLVANVFSSSFSAPHLFGDRSSEFEADLRAVLAGASPSGVFSVRLPDNVLNISRVARS